MGKKLTETHTINHYECDTTGKLTMPMLLNIVIKTSESQSEELGRGAKFVAKYGLTWVITRYDIQIKRLPQAQEKVFVTTEAVSYNKYFCYRNFWIHDENKEECVLIESTFALMNLENRKMGSVPEKLIAPFTSEKITKIKRGAKILPVTSHQFLNYRVRFSDIDGNQHVNNSRYFDWMLDVLGYDFLVEHEAESVAIKFDKEVEYGNEINSFWEFEQEEPMSSRHQIKVGDLLCAEANIKWRKN